MFGERWNHIKMGAKTAAVIGAAGLTAYGVSAIAGGDGEGFTTTASLNKEAEIDIAFEVIDFSRAADTRVSTATTETVLDVQGIDVRVEKNLPFGKSQTIGQSSLKYEVAGAVKTNFLVPAAALSGANLNGKLSVGIDTDMLLVESAWINTPLVRPYQLNDGVKDYYEKSRPDSALMMMAGAGGFLGNDNLNENLESTEDSMELELPKIAINQWNETCSDKFDEANKVAITEAIAAMADGLGVEYEELVVSFGKDKETPEGVSLEWNEPEPYNSTAINDEHGFTSTFVIPDNVEIDSASCTVVDTVVSPNSGELDG